MDYFILLIHALDEKVDIDGSILVDLSHGSWVSTFMF
jgi:hypothetical protein